MFVDPSSTGCVDKHAIKKSPGRGQDQGTGSISLQINRRYPSVLYSKETDTMANTEVFSTNDSTTPVEVYNVNTGAAAPQAIYCLSAVVGSNGVTAKSTGVSGIGVHATGSTKGVYATADDTNGNGVYATVSGAYAHAVIAYGSSPNGYPVLYAENSDNSTTAPARFGIGGKCTGTSSAPSVGVIGESSGSAGIGVKGVGYGANGVGVAGYGNGTSALCYGVAGMCRSVALASPKRWSGWAPAPLVMQGTFLGQATLPAGSPSPPAHS